jgi:CPA1 family monovalent cation:H+ antiporter
VQLARAETARAGLAVVEGTERGNEILEFLRRKYAARIERVELDGRGGSSPEVDSWQEFGRVVQRAQAAERRTLSDLRSRGVIGDDAFHQVEEELDWSEAAQGRNVLAPDQDGPRI